MSITNKNSQQTRNRREFPKSYTLKGICEKSSNSILHGKRLNVFPLGQEQDKDVSPYHFYSLL